MGVDWTALEEAIRVSALRQAEEIIDRHPNEVFYAVALDGVSADETDHLDLPVLALNSLQALARKQKEEEDEEVVVEDDFDDDEDEGFEERPDAEDDGSGREYEDDEDEDEDDEEDEEDLDDVLKELEAMNSVEEQGFYSSKWNPPDWFWCSIELFDDSATELWSQALTSVAKHHGWEETNRLYYEMLIRVTDSLRQALAVGRNADMVVYLSDEEHADRILRRCLTQDQLAKHFPELAY
ncbi:hypothetical protein ACFY5D_15120 [Paeniglutamicibacter sp. NPDC012692]|uniref:hypothetical protein n=1 Tax=Paeniglutamicibacter sp. NPDC012692 TaxID=3364388 RepID=UPI0036B9561A